MRILEERELNFVRTGENDECLCPFIMMPTYVDGDLHHEVCWLEHFPFPALSEEALAERHEHRRGRHRDQNQTTTSWRSLPAFQVELASGRRVRAYQAWLGVTDLPATHELVGIRLSGENGWLFTFVPGNEPQQDAIPDRDLLAVVSEHIQSIRREYPEADAADVWCDPRTCDRLIYDHRTDFTYDPRGVETMDGSHGTVPWLGYPWYRVTVPGETIILIKVPVPFQMCVLVDYPNARYWNLLDPLYGSTPRNIPDRILQQVMRVPNPTTPPTAIPMNDFDWALPLGEQPPGFTWGETTTIF